MPQNICASMQISVFTLRSVRAFKMQSGNNVDRPEANLTL